MADIAFSNLPSEISEPISGDMLAIDDITAGVTKRMPYELVFGGNYYLPNRNETDQGATGSGKTIKAYVDAIGSVTKATILIRHCSGGASTTYTLTTSLIITENITLIIEPGAIIDGAGTLTIKGPFKRGLVQAFGSSITILFGVNAVTDIYPEWWGEFPNDYNDTTYLNKAIAASDLVGSHSGVDDANIIVRPGRYYLTQDGLSTIKTNLIAPNAYFSAIDNVVTGGALFNFDFTEWGSANNIVDIGTILGKQVQDDVAHYNVGIKISGGDSCRMRVGSILGLYAGIMSYGPTHQKHVGMWDIDIDTLMGCDFGIYAVSGTTAGTNAGFEGNRIKIRYAAYCDYVSYFESNHADAIHIQGNFVRVGGLELHHRANQVGFYVSGADTYSNTFIADGNVINSSTSKVLTTANNAADNRFEICELDWAKINQSGGDNVIRETSNKDTVLDRQEETLTAAGACSVYGLTNLNTTAGAMAMTLADGTYVGQVKEIYMSVDNGNATLTVTNHVTSSPEVFTFADVGDYLKLIWCGTKWATDINCGVGV